MQPVFVQRVLAGELGGGFPVGALGGRAEIMAGVDGGGVGAGGESYQAQATF